MAHLHLLHISYENIDCIWRLNFDIAVTNGYPVLELSDTLDPKYDVKDKVQNSPDYMAIIYPAVIREILTEISNDADTSIDDDNWQGQWLQLIYKKIGKKIPIKLHDESDDIHKENLKKWISECVDEFITKLEIEKNYIDYMERYQYND